MFALDPIFFPTVALAAAAGDKPGLPPEVRANVLPRSVNRGDMLQVQALFVDRETGSPRRVDVIYVTIRNREGVEVWPTSPVALGRSGMIIDLPTRQLPPGEYNIIVSDSTSLSPAKTVDFTVTGPPLEEPAPVFEKLEKKEAIRRAPIPSDKEGLAKKKDVVPMVPLLKDDGVTPNMQSGLVRFITELDFKVCAVCAVFDQETYDSNDPEKPQIPLHPNCRCHYEYVTSARP